MKKLNGSSNIPQRVVFTWLYAAFFSVSFNAAGDVAQAPLSLSEGVPPNMIFTLDDSTSMNRAFVPDVAGTNAEQERDDVRHTRRSKSAHFNPVYYNPDVTYRIPPSFNSSGVEVELSTSFNKAFYDGFLPNKNNGNDWSNLASDYRVSWNYNKTNNGRGSSYTGSSNAAQNSILAKNPDSDFSCSVQLSSNNTEKTCTTDAGISITIKRGNSANASSCRGFSASLPEVACTRTGNSNTNYTYTASWAEQPTRGYYYIYDRNLDSCNKTKSDENCYKLQFVETDEEQNFANWYSFYRNRALATLTAASLAFYDLSPSARLTWQSLIHCKSLNSSASNCGTNNFRSYSPTHRGNFFSWLQTGTRFNQADGTPLRWATQRAGDFLTNNIAWHHTPGGNQNTAANTYACRPSYHIVMTDGMWTNTNESGNLNNPSNHDNTSIALPDGKNYTNNRHPYSDSSSNTLADIAMHYWATDLNTNLANKIKPHMPFKSGNDSNDYWDPRNNPATWQSMTNFIMGLGLTESLNNVSIPWEGSTFKGAGYEALKSGTAWPAASSGSQNNVYDLWHAAINSRGEFFSVDSPDAMVQAFADILSRIADRKSTASRPAVNSTMEDDGTGNSFVRYFYQTSYASDENWAGDLKRIKRELLTDATETTTELWSAKSKLNSKDPDTRNIKIAATSGASRLQNFTWGQISSAANTTGSLAHYLRINPEDGVLGSTTSAQERLNFIRGSRTGEGTTFRQRVHVLGDLYSSAPAIVSGPRYLESFANRLEGNTAYTTFINRITSRTNPDIARAPRVYVGGNDGMLHAFDANTGEETFAFIPTAVFSKLNKLTGKNYSHEFYVDGSPVVADVYFGSEWRTILVGTLRAGGKSLFALDITTPGEEKLLWEFNENSIAGNNAVKPGYSFSKPTIARLHTGKWAVVTGNGYEGRGTEDGKAALYIIDAETGNVVKSLEIQGDTGIKNGLSTPRLADYNNDGIADYAYAGDLQGNLWRFDLLGAQASPTRTDGSIYGNDKSNADGFKVSYGDKPLFKATSTTGSAKQPITAPPSLIRHPTREGYLVIFGTGKYFETTDKDGEKSYAQSVYGIWDRSTKAEATSAITINRGDLVEQQINSSLTATADDGSTRTARTITNNPITWLKDNGTVDKYGWRLDLRVGTSAFDGEMLIEDLSALGQTIFFQTLVPNDDPCDSGASNWTYAINPFTGGKTQHHPFDYKGNNNAVVSGIQQSGEGGFSISTTPEGRYDLSTGSETIRVYADPTSIGRQSWRIVGEQ